MPSRKDLDLALTRLTGHIMAEGMVPAKAVEVFCGELHISLLDVVRHRLRPGLEHREGCEGYTSMAMSCSCTCGAKVECALPPHRED
jgi:hypothetical protein